MDELSLDMKFTGGSTAVLVASKSGQDSRGCTVLYKSCHVRLASLAGGAIGSPQGVL